MNEKELNEWELNLIQKKWKEQGSKTLEINLDNLEEAENILNEAFETSKEEQEEQLKNMFKGEMKLYMVDKNGNYYEIGNDEK